ncbi:MAG: hypothetical protein U9P12_06065, partial [Verrucomicrobiota bacterium]|nr:hypothetical protein [Verrucomicrobiota bacterium]
SSVSKMPLNPHIKNRSRAQQKVVGACLELGRGDLAEDYIVRIANWQRWKGFSDLAYYYAERDQMALAEAALQHSEAALSMADDLRSGKILASTPNPLIDTLEGWRYKQVRARLYEVEALLGKNEAQQPLGDLDLGEEIDATFAAHSVTEKQADYEAAMEQLARLAGHANFEVTQQALLGMVRLADTNYDQLDLSTWTEKELVPHFKKTPVFMRVNVLVQLADVALRHNDTLQTEKICDQIEGYIDHAALPVGLRITEKTKGVSLRFKAGNERAARKQLDVLLGLYTSNRDFIVDIDRAEILCRMAEGYQLTGQTTRALSLYEKAVVEGQVNPNSRPRADALNEIACSLAMHSVVPPEVFFRSLEELGNQLGRPW